MHNDERGREVNPTTTDAQPAPDLKSLRESNRLRREKLRADELTRMEQLSQRRSVKESWQTDWIAPWLDAVRQQRDGFIGFGGGVGIGISGRSHGQNYPVYRSEQELGLLRFPSRWLGSTNSYAIGLKGGICGYILGSGLTYRVMVKDEDTAEANEDLLKMLQGAVDDILEKNEWHGGEMPGFEEEFVDRSIEDGEAIALHEFTDPGTGITAVRFLEPEQLTQPHASGEEWKFGVRTDEKDSETPLEYFVAWDDAQRESDHFTPEQITHFRRNAKRGMKRGVPDFSFDTYDQLDMAAKLMGNSGDAAASQAAIVSVMKFKTGTQSEIQAVNTAGNDYYGYDGYQGQQIGVRKSRRGTNEYIPDSQEYTSGPAASNATAHLAIHAALLRSAGVRWNAPEWLGSSDASNNSYASGGTAERSFFNRIIREQKRYCAAFRRIVWYAVEQWCKVKLPGKSWDEIETLFKFCVEAPSPISEDELKEAQVAAIEIPLGVQSRQAYAQERGREWKQIEADNAEWEADHGGDVDPATGKAFVGGDESDDETDPKDDGELVQESWNESKHPRDRDGKFGRGRGGSGVKKKTAAIDAESEKNDLASFAGMTKSEFDAHAWFHGQDEDDAHFGKQQIHGGVTKSFAEAASYAGLVYGKTGGQVRIVPHSALSEKQVKRIGTMGSGHKIIDTLKDSPAMSSSVSIPITETNPHEYLVKKAMASGIDIPDRVLKDYPNLAKQVKKPDAE